MTDLNEAPVETAPRQRKERKAPPKIDAAAVLAATQQPEYDVGDWVLYRPHDMARATMRSGTGVDIKAFAALITFVYPDGKVCLMVFPPFGRQPLPAMAVAYSEEMKPDTFGLKVAK